MPNAKYWQEVAQDHADALRGEGRSLKVEVVDLEETDDKEREDTPRAPFGAYVVPINPAAIIPAYGVLYGKREVPFEDDPVARKAVEVLRENFKTSSLPVVEKAHAVDSEDGSTWVLIVHSLTKPIEDQISLLVGGVDEAYRTAREQE